MDGIFNFQVISDNFTYFMIGRFPEGPLGGVGLTLWLALASCILSLFGGMILGLLCLSKNRLIQYPVTLMINAVRGVPLLMVIFWMYFLLPALFGKVAETNTVIMALTIFTSAYMSQIVKAGIEGIPKGQAEAAISTGLKPWQAMLFVVLPQGMRNMIPSFVNQFVSLIKDTSLAFIVGVSELTQVGTQINNRTMAFPTEIFIFIAVIYFMLCYAFTSFSRWLEGSLAWRKAI